MRGTGRACVSLPKECVPAGKAGRGRERGALRGGEDGAEEDLVGGLEEGW